MALPLRSEPPAHVQPAGVPAARRIACRQRSSPWRGPRTVVAVAAGTHGARRRTVIARGVVVALGIAVFVAVTQVAVLVGPHLVTSPPSGPAAVDPVAGAGVGYRIVGPGDTLWSIAGELRGGGDVRARVDRLARLNGGATITAGQTVVVPLDWMQP